MTVQKGLLEALRVLLLQPEAAKAETCGALEADLTEVVRKAVLRAAGELRNGLGDASAAAALCRFLASIAEVGVLAEAILPPPFKLDLLNAACVAAKLHSSDEHAQNWAIWLRAMVDGSLLLQDLREALMSSCTVTVRSALWVTQELAQRRELQNPGAFLPLVLQAMALPEVGDRGAQALEALCDYYGEAWNRCLAPQDKSALLRIIEEVLLRHLDDDWQVVSALLFAISNLVGLEGHLSLLKNSKVTSNNELTRAVLFHIGSPRKTHFEAFEVVHSDAICIVSKFADIPSQDLCELVLYALQRLLDVTSSLGSDCESTMSQGLTCLIRTLRCIDLGTLRSDSNLMRHFLHALKVVAACQLTTVRSQLCAHRESIWRVVHTRFLASDAQLDELKQLCELVFMLEGVKRLEEILRSRPVPELPMRAACEVIIESDLEVSDISSHAVSLVQSSLDLFDHYAARGHQPVVGELNAVAGVLGKALGHMDVANAGQSSPLIERGLVVLTKLTEYAVDNVPTSDAYFSTLHHCFWSLREIVSSTGGAHETAVASRTWLRSPQVLRVLERALNSVMQSVAAAGNIDETDSQWALEEGLTLVALLHGSHCVLNSMQLHPQNRSVQAASCKTLRMLAQIGEIHGDCADVIAALQWAQREHDGDAEIDTPAAHALGLIQMSSHQS